MVRTAEEVLLPARFLALMGHFLACLTLLLDRNNVAVASIPPHNFAADKSALVGLAWAAVICCVIEIVLLFAGFTMFMRGVGAMHVVLHAAGLVLTALFIDAHWSVRSLGAIFTLFNLVPVLVESWMALYTVKFAFRRF